MIYCKMPKGMFQGTFPLLKKGVIRRGLGLARQTLASICLATAAFTGAALAAVTEGVLSLRPDLMEVFGGHAEISYQFSHWGWATET